MWQREAKTIFRSLVLISEMYEQHFLAATILFMREIINELYVQAAGSMYAVLLRLPFLLVIFWLSIVHIGIRIGARRISRVDIELAI